MMRSPAIFAALAIGLAATPALAASPVKVTVRLGDLDLASDAGAHAAMTRLARAAAEACGEQAAAVPYLMRQSASFQRCRAETLAAAVSRVPGAAIIAAYAETRGQPLRFAGR